MQLGKPKKQTELMKDLQKEGKLFAKPAEEEVKVETAAVVNPLLENVMVEVEEKVSCALNRDGELNKLEVKGIIYLTVNDPKKNNPAAQLAFTPVKGFTFKPHPELDKQLWNKSKVICAADQEQGFPAQTRLDAIRYNYRSKDEADMPFTLNVFNSKKQNKTVVTLELEANQNCSLNFQKLERVTVALNMGDNAVDIEVQKAAGASVEQDEAQNQLLWHVANVTEAGSAVLQFASQALRFDDLFPIDIRFDETYSLIGLGVQHVGNAASGDAMSVKTLHSLSTDSY